MSSRYDKWLIPRLGKLAEQRKALELIPKQIKLLDMKMTVKASNPDKVIVDGGTNHSEDAMIENILKRDELERNLKFVTEEVQIMDSALEILSEDEKTVLDRMYIHRVPKGAESLSQELNCEIANVYRTKDKALTRLARCLAGIAEL